MGQGGVDMLLGLRKFRKNLRCEKGADDLKRDGGDGAPMRVIV